MSALRLLTAGSVDDGKSTLIGRLLLDSRALLVDQVQGLQARHARSAAGLLPVAAVGAPDFDLSLLTDGLEAEREQGITIDVAWRYFSTQKRKFVLADTPGHEQYTRNMVTAAAGADAAVVLVDATKVDTSDALPTLLPQTRRHALLAHLLRVPHIVFAVNKLDAVGNAAQAFTHLRAALLAFAKQAGFVPAGIVPISALRGDNVAQQAPGFAGQHGPALLELLEALPSDAAAEAADALALPVQYVARHGDGANPQRVFWGRIASGQVRMGDTLQVLPGGELRRVLALRHHAEEVPSASAGQSVGVVLDAPVDVSRGDWLVAPGSMQMAQSFDARLAWLDNEPLRPGRKLLLRHGNRWVAGQVQALHSRLDISNLQRDSQASELAANDIGEVRVALAQALPLQSYAQSRVAGALLAVDPHNHRTGGALLVQQAVATN